MPADELPGNVELEIEGRRERENAKMGTILPPLRFSNRRCEVKRRVSRVNKSRGKYG